MKCSLCAGERERGKVSGQEEVMVMSEIRMRSNGKGSLGEQEREEAAEGTPANIL